METQFEIYSYLEKKHYVEYYRYIWRKRIPVAILFAVLGIVLLALHLLTDSYHLFTGIWSVLYAIFLYFRPWMVAAKTIKQETKFDGTEMVESVTKFGDEIQDASKHLSMTAPYDKIEDIHFSEYTIVIKDSRKNYLILDKNGFTKGTFEEFLLFIQEKCPQLNLPKWQ